MTQTDAHVVPEPIAPTEAELRELHDVLTECGLPGSGLSDRQEEVLVLALERSLEDIWENSPEARAMQAAMGGGAECCGKPIHDGDPERYVLTCCGKAATPAPEPESFDGLVERLKRYLDDAAMDADQSFDGDRPDLWDEDIGVLISDVHEAAARIEADAAEKAAKDAEIERLNLALVRTCAREKEEVARAEAAETRAAKAEATIASCQWYWPEDDTSEYACGSGPQEVIEAMYGWKTPTGEVCAVARGGIVEVTYCASLPPADASDDDYWVEESTPESAEIKIKQEIDRRAALAKQEGE